MARNETPELKAAGPPGKVPVAQYWAEPEWWNDVPEAKPRCRVRVPEGSERLMVRVFADGTIDAPGGVQVDPYENHPTVRDEEIP